MVDPIAPFSLGLIHLIILGFFLKSSQEVNDTVDWIVTYMARHNGTIYIYYGTLRRPWLLPGN